MSATTTKPEPFLTPADSNALLRGARELLEQGRLLLASASGWRVALSAAATYAGPAGWPVDGDGDRYRDFFTDAARRLVRDPGRDDRAAEWAASALALYDNVQYDWLDREGVGRRLDDMQRLTILAQDIAEPPQNADDLLRRAWQCVDNGALAVASEKGWAAATYAAKVYAEAMGYDRIRSNYLDQVSHLLMKESGGKDAGAWSIAVDVMLESAYYSPDALHPDVVADGLKAAKNLVSFIASLMPPQRAC